VRLRDGSRLNNDVRHAGYLAGSVLGNVYKTTRTFQGFLTPTLIHVQCMIFDRILPSPAEKDHMVDLF